MKSIVKIDGMSCQHCVMAVKKEILKLNVQNLEVKLGEAVVEFDEMKLTENDISKAIKNAGYSISNK
ncbi:MAG: cation transporter [Ignavibacterium sp.]|jgi:copper chaperone|nr:cation transporter [Ignavibacterium sp.]